MDKHIRIEDFDKSMTIEQNIEALSEALTCDDCLVLERKRYKNDTEGRSRLANFISEKYCSPNYTRSVLIKSIMFGLIACIIILYILDVFSDDRSSTPPVEQGVALFLFIWGIMSLFTFQLVIKINR